MTSGIILHGCIVGALMRPPPVNPSTESVKRGRRKCSGLVEFSILKNGSFCLFLISTFMVLCGHLVPYMYMPIRCEYLNIDSSEIPLLISVMGVASGVARISFGLIADMHYFRSRRGGLFATMTLCTGLFLSASVFLNGFVALFVFSIGFGFLSGAFYLS